MKTDVYEIYVTRNLESVFVGSCPLSTAKRIHGKTIKTINYDSKTIFLDPKKSKFGK